MQMSLRETNTQAGQGLAMDVPEVGLRRFGREVGGWSGCREQAQWTEMNWLSDKPEAERRREACHNRAAASSGCTDKRREGPQRSTETKAVEECTTDDRCGRWNASNCDGQSTMLQSERNKRYERYETRGDEMR